jgi:hypothetical protein
MNFTPVQRRAHANGWTPEHQRAFIAALAITGSPRQAARAIGKHQFGAEGLRTAKTGRSFAAAWDAAMELARERETHRIHDNLAELAVQREEELAALSPSSPGRGGGAYEPAYRGYAGSELAKAVEGTRSLPATGHFPPGYDPEYDDDERLEYLTAQQQVRERMLRSRRLLLMLFSGHPEKRAAWEELCGPVDWEKAARLEAEDGEAYAMKHARDADVIITAEAGFLPEMTGGRDGVAEIFEEAFAMQARGELEGPRGCG